MSPSSRTPTAATSARRRWLFPVYLVPINLFVAAARDRGADAVSRRRDRPRPDRARAAAQRRRARARADDDDRRPFGGDRHGRRRQRRARDHRLQRSRDADPAAPARGADRGGGRRDRRAGADGAPRSRSCCVLALGYLYARFASDAALAAIGLLSFAAIAQIAAGVPRRAGLAARHGARRGGGHDRRLARRGSICCSCPRSTPRARSRDLLELGPLGVAWLRPAALVSFSRLSARRRRRAVARRQYPRLRRLFADAPGQSARAHAGDRLRRRQPRRQAAGVPAVARLGDGRRARGDGRALSRRAARAHAPSTTSLPSAASQLSASEEADAHLIRHAEHLLSPGDRRLDLAARAVAAAAPARDVGQVRRSNCSTTPRRRSSRAAISCSTRSTTRARASRCSTPISR